MPAGLFLVIYSRSESWSWWCRAWARTMMGPVMRAVVRTVWRRTKDWSVMPTAIWINTVPYEDTYMLWFYRLCINNCSASRSRIEESRISNPVASLFQIVD